MQEVCGRMVEKMQNERKWRSPKNFLSYFLLYADLMDMEYLIRRIPLYVTQIGSDSFHLVTSLLMKKVS